MKHIVLYSGGLSSFFTAKIVVEKYGAENVLCLFTDTSTEDEDLYRFIKETISLLGCDLKVLKDGRDIWGVFTDVKFMGNSRIDPCSRVLKRDIFSKWLKKNFKPEECILYYGINWDEEHRYIKIKERWQPYQVEAPLCDPPIIGLNEMKDFLTSVNIDIPKLYTMGFPHNNCGGFCVKTGQAQFKLLLEKMPERYMQHEEAQEKLFETIGSRRPFIRMQRDGDLKYLSLKEFREHLQSNGQIDLFDYGGCACFA